MNVGFTILICTYNPKDEILLRLLKAIQNLKKCDGLYQIIIVDNNSLVPLTSRNYIRDFIVNEPHATVIVEKNPGLTEARIAGIRKAKFDWLIFFDDDNEPSVSYLENAKSLIINHAEVGMWGPGKIQVEYQKEKVSVWYSKNKSYYQDISVAVTNFDKSETWSDCYPNGTGLLIRRDVALYYKDLVESDILRLSDRIGKSLMSGGDTQMVFCGIKMGYYAGISPDLQMKHLISADKMNRKYVLRQVYLTSSCYVKAFNEIGFKDKKIEIVLEGNLRILSILYLTLRSGVTNLNLKNPTIIFYRRLGEINARYLASDTMQKPFFLRFFELLINV